VLVRAPTEGADPLHDLIGALDPDEWLRFAIARSTSSLKGFLSSWRLLRQVCLAVEVRGLPFGRSLRAFAVAPSSPAVASLKEWGRVCQPDNRTGRPVSTTSASPRVHRVAGDNGYPDAGSAHDIEDRTTRRQHFPSRVMSPAPSSFPWPSPAGR
jgi:hypothetical protein